MWHASHHATAIGQGNEVAGYRHYRGSKGKSKATEKILGKEEKGKHGLIELRSIQKKKEAVVKKRGRLKRYFFL